MEVSARRHWVLGSPRADDVTIEGFTMLHAANESRSGALMNRESRSAPGGSHWTVQNNEQSHAHGAVISLKAATGLRILDNDISNGGQIGINGAGNSEVIRRNDIHHNNTENYNIAGTGVTEAGGAKFAPEVENVVLAYNEVYSSTRYEWNRTGYSQLVNFNIARAEEKGRYLTQSGKDSVVAHKGIPAKPLPR